ncbi:KRAB-A domain-containing protein 2-like [Galleria mellonella]|uniref:KRAB-A domain-containing protein 2-like n=1 Tax=Galleria mellonella TaxID=7137 RepID=A0A6J3C033_GALME|nr:KRAB-A domain-containing protein 2-like [Galleria mellonella]
MCAMFDKDDTRKRFEKELHKIYRERSTKPQWTKKRIAEVINFIEEYNCTSDHKALRTSAHYHYYKLYDVMEKSQTKILIKKRKKHSDPVVQIVASEDYYDILSTIHESTKHGGRDKMISAMKSKYLIPVPVVRAFIKCCTLCKKRNPKTSSKNLGLVDVIDLQSIPDGNYKWVLHYQDYVNKFSFLRPLTSNSISDVACELLKIFLEIGCPNTLYSNYSQDFSVAITRELDSMWPGCNVIATSRYPKDEENKSDGDIEDLIRAWMIESNSTNWAYGIYFVQYKMNCSFHKGIQNTPYKAFFGKSPRVELTPLHETIDIKVESVDSSDSNESETLPALEEVLIEEENATDCGASSSQTTDYKFTRYTIKNDSNVSEIVPSNKIESGPSKFSITKSCHVCGRSATSSFTCCSCNNVIHYSCAEIIQKEAPFKLLCFVCQGTDRCDVSENITAKEETKIKKDNEMECETECNNRASKSCYVCGKPATSAFTCHSCDNIVHYNCAEKIGQKGSPFKFLCFICQHNDNRDISKTAHSNKTIEIKQEKTLVCEIKCDHKKGSLKTCCHVCGKQATPAFSCYSCDNNVHFNCAEIIGQKGTPFKLLCFVCQKTKRCKLNQI